MEAEKIDWAILGVGFFLCVGGQRGGGYELAAFFFLSAF